MVVPFTRYVWLDFTAANPDLATLDVTNTATFDRYVTAQLDGAVGVGGYGEDRVIYRRSAHFQQEAEPRTVHLGIDVWAPAGTPVFAPRAGRVHSFADNNNFGDYGPAIILEHDLPEGKLYSLYGHLSRASLRSVFVGKNVAAGEKLAELGPYPENGDWPPHLHFQLIRDLQGHAGDYPGVCAPSERSAYLANCPDPAAWLGIIVKG